MVARKRLESPVDSSWYFEESVGRETILANQGSWVLGVILGLLAANLFWNGIIGVLVVKAIAEGSGWLKILFMTPFVLIGLALAVVLLILFLDPFRKITYTFSDREIAWSWKYFGIGRTKTWEMVPPVEIGISLEQDDDTPDEHKDGTDYKLIFSGKGTQKVEIDSLNLAEAEWIATQLDSDQASYAFQKASDNIDRM